MTEFQAASGTGADWLTACDACIADFSTSMTNANLGFVYASDPLAHALDLIAERLREATGIDLWVGTGGSGVCTSGCGVFESGAVVVLATTLPSDGFQVFDGCLDQHHSATKRHAPRFAVVHGDPRQTKTPAMIEQLSKDADAFLVGGLTSANGNGAMQLAGKPTEGGLSGVLISSDVPMITGLTQGCTPIGPMREITSIDGPWIKTLDGEPALAMLKNDIGPVLAKNLNRMAGFILAARPHGDRDEYLVRGLAESDPIHQWIMVNDDFRRGDHLCFVKRDPEAAKADLRRLTADLRKRAGDKAIKGALYHSCMARGQHMFGTDSSELSMIEEELGAIPLAGLFTNGEIYDRQLYGYSGVLTLFLGK